MIHFRLTNHLKIKPKITEISLLFIQRSLHYLISRRRGVLKEEDLLRDSSQNINPLQSLNSPNKHHNLSKHPQLGQLLLVNQSNIKDQDRLIFLPTDHLFLKIEHKHQQAKSSIRRKDPFKSRVLLLILNPPLNFLTRLSKSTSRSSKKKLRMLSEQQTSKIKVVST